jgi:hypothetical protein
MIQLKSLGDLRQVSPDDPAYPILDDLVRRLIDEYPPYDPEADGWVVLVEPLDVDRGITEIWDAETTLADLLWEHMSIRPKPGRSVATGSTSRKTSSMPLATPFTRSSTDARWSLSTPSQ